MSHLNPRVTVLLAAYNGMKWVDQQVKTILSQKGVNVSLVVSVDKSSDGTEEYFSRLAKDDRRVILLKTGLHFGGAGANFYRLIRDSNFLKSDYVAFSDQDDLWNLDKLETSIQTLLQTNSSAFSSNVNAFWEDGRTCLVHKAQPQRSLDYWFESAGPGCTFVLNRKLALDLQKFCTLNFSKVNSFKLHDWFTYAYARVNDYKWHISPEVTMDYRQHDSNQVGTNNNLKAYFKRFRQVRSHDYREQVLLLQDILNSNSRSFFPNITKSGYLSSLKLLTNLHQLRRRSRDRYALLFFIILGIF